MPTGDFESLIETVSYANTIADTLGCLTLLRVSDTIYAMCHGAKPIVYTFSCDSDGDLSDAYIATKTFTATATSMARMFHVSGNVYGILYNTNVSGNRYMRIVTFTIDSAGAISNAIADTAISSNGTQYLVSRGRDVQHVAGTVYAFAGSILQTNYYITLKTFSVSADGVTISAISINSHLVSARMTACLGEITANTFIVFVRQRGANLLAYTYTIADDGTITDIDSMTVQVNTTADDFPIAACAVSTSIWIVGSEVSGNNRLTTIEVALDGTLGSVLDTDDAIMPYDYVFQLSNVLSAFWIVTSGQNGGAQAATFTVAADGTIGAVIDTWTPADYHYDIYIEWTEVDNLYVGIYQKSDTSQWGFSIGIIRPSGYTQGYIIG